jgi:hypothetical protein
MLWSQSPHKLPLNCRTREVSLISSDIFPPSNDCHLPRLISRQGGAKSSSHLLYLSVRTELLNFYLLFYRTSIYSAIDLETFRLSTGSLCSSKGATTINPHTSVAIVLVLVVSDVELVSRSKMENYDTPVDRQAE